MKIKDNLNLNGYILQNFCIDNYDSLDGINDKNKGRAVFLTGNDTNAGYGHVNVYDGTSFKALAYVDDVANNEEFLAVKRKVDAFFDGGVDADNVLENLAEVQKFLDNYSGATSLSQILDTKLDKSGGEISSNNVTPLKIKTSTVSNLLSFVANNVEKTVIGYYASSSRGSEFRNVVSGAYIGITDDGTPHYNGNTLLHSGNIGEYKAGGLAHSNGTIGAILNSSGNVTIGASDLAETVYKLYVDGKAKIKNGLSLEGSGIYWANDVVNYSIAPTSNFEIIYTGFRGHWFKTNGIDRFKILQNGNVLIGTTDDNGSGAKLQINGSIDTSGEVYLNHNKSIRLKGSNGTNYNVLFTSGTDLQIGYDSPVIRFGDVKMFINSSGNVGIGTTNPTEKLHVVGNLHVTGNIIADGEVSAGGAGQEGGGSSSGGGGAFHSEGIAVGATQTTIAHGLGTDDIVVSIYEKDGVSGRWSIILTDVEIVDVNNIIVSFGSATTVEHKVVIMGAVA